MDWPALSLEVIAEDDPLVWVVLRASNGRYAGTTTSWVTLERIGQFATAIEGFPAAANDEREFSFGDRVDLAGPTRYPRVSGFCGLEFTYGAPGGATMRVGLEDDESDTAVSFRVHLEAAAVDRFVAGLRLVAAASPAELVGRRVELV